jgi:hypothetical protein
MLLKELRLLSNEKTNGIKATLNESIEISANHPSLGHAIEKLMFNIMVINKKLDLMQNTLLKHFQFLMKQKLFLSLIMS